MMCTYFVNDFLLINQLVIKVYHRYVQVHFITKEVSNDVFNRRAGGYTESIFIPCVAEVSNLFLQPSGHNRK